MTSPTPLLTLGRPSVLPGAARGLPQRTLVAAVRLNTPAPPELEDRLAQILPPPVREALPPARPQTPAEQAPVDLVGRLCIALQVAAGQPVEAHRVLPTRQADVLELAVTIHAPDVGIASLRCAAQLLAMLAAPQTDLNTTATQLAGFLSEAARRDPVLPNTLAFIRSARRLSMPWRHIGDGIYQFGLGARARRLKGAFTDGTPSIASQIARRKPVTSTLLQGAGLPVPRQQLAGSAQECVSLAESLGFPVVVKPLSQDQGTGVSINLRTPQAVQAAYEVAAAHGRTVIVEQHVPGDDHRLLVVQGRLLAAARRLPAIVTGDGQSSVRELVARLNQDPRRGTHKKSLMIRLEIDAPMQALLADQGLTPDSVPAAGQRVPLCLTPNISTGGTAEDVLGIVHPDNAELAIRAVRLIGLDMAGVDFLSPDISRPWHEVGGAICEVNAQPGFRPHWLAEPMRDVNGDILRLLFGNTDGRIPVACVSGTDSAAVGLTLQHLLVHHGLQAGWAGTRGIRIGERTLVTTPLPNNHTAGQILLSDPLVETAVIDQPLHTVRDEGFAFDLCDVAALLDLLPTPQVPDEAERRFWAMEVLQRTRQAVVVNADDPQCLSLAERLPARHVVLVASLPQHPAVAAHLDKGHRAAIWGGSQPAFMEGRTVHPLPVSLPPHTVWAATIAWALTGRPEVISAGLNPEASSAPATAGAPVPPASPS